MPRPRLRGIPAKTPNGDWGILIRGKIPIGTKADVQQLDRSGGIRSGTAKVITEPFRSKYPPYKRRKVVIAEYIDQEPINTSQIKNEKHRRRFLDGKPYKTKR